MKQKILTGTSSFGKFDSKPLEVLEQAGYEVMLNPHARKLSKDEVMNLLNGVTGLIAGLEPLDADVLRKSELKVISRVGVGISNIDLKVAEELGIKVCSTPDAPTDAVAELTVAGILNGLRHIPQMDRDLHQGKWIRQNGSQLKGKTVLIVGYGRIGRRVAELLAVFGVKLLIVDPLVEAVNRVSLEAGLKQADIVTLHLSGEHCVLGPKEFSLIKKGAYICNAARGTLIDESALIQALDSGVVRGCWLDTFEDEPYSGPLTNYDQAILTPHVGSFTRECRIQMEKEATHNLISALS